MKILVVEDEQVLAKVFQEKFEKAHYDVKIAVDGEAALSEAKSFNPDVIVLDLVLPKKNGFDVLSELKADDSLKIIPVVVVSNLGEDEDIKRALSLGAIDYFVKAQHPINEIVSKVKAVSIKSK
jgi:two-component system alkaline phosphatase synthesis response regulator PhoP